MKRAVARTFSGPRGREKTTAAIVILTTLILTLILGGCGGSGSQSTGTGSQLDQRAAGASAAGNTGTNATGTATAPAVSGNEQVLAGYTADQCLADMAARYGTSSDAQRVCAQVHRDFGANAPKTQLPAALTQTESKLGVKPVAGQPPAANVSAGNGGGAPAGGGTTGGGSGGTSSGWDNGGIVITVPQGPAGP